MQHDKALREHLVSLLTQENAHAGFEVAVRDMPAKHFGTKPKGVDHSAWELLEHLRIAQWDILEFSRNPKHVSPKWPQGYWPESPTPPTPEAWDHSVKEFERDLKEMVALVQDQSVDLLAKIGHGEGQTVLREALLIADHNAYHIGQLVQLRKMLGAWH
jgi:DinB superfamily